MGAQRSRVTLADGRRIEVAVRVEPLERLLAVGAPGRIGLHDERADRWVWLELSEVSGVEPVAELDASQQAVAPPRDQRGSSSSAARPAGGSTQ